MEKKLSALYVLPVLFLLILFSGCDFLFNPFDGGTEDTQSTNKPETTAPSVNTDSIDDVFADFSPAGMSSDWVVIKTRAEFLSVYSNDQLSQEQIINKASQYFDAAFFENHFLVIIRSKLPYQRLFLNVVSVLERDSVLNIGLRLHRPYDAEISSFEDYRGHIILVLSRAYFSSETVNITYVNREYENEALLNRDITTGVLFADSQFEKQRDDKQARDFQTLEKFKP